MKIKCKWDVVYLLIWVFDTLHFIPTLKEGYETNLTLYLNIIYLFTDVTWLTNTLFYTWITGLELRRVLKRYLHTSHLSEFEVESHFSIQQMWTTLIEPVQSHGDIKSSTQSPVIRTSKCINSVHLTLHLPIIILHNSFFSFIC